jgi:DNA-directed RNA polymerase subunit beta
LKAIARKDYGKIPSVVPIPNLLNIQLESFRSFLQAEVAPEKRRDEGLESVFRNAFPIEDVHGRYSLEYVSYSLGQPKYMIEECQDRDTTYSVPVKAILKLVVREETKTGGRKVRDVIEQNVYLGELPLMTERGTFIINGAERVVVNQLHRSPGVFFSEDTHPSGKRIYSSQVIPYRGSWLEFTYDSNDALFFSIDKRRKMPVTVLLRALGYATNREILSLFHEATTLRSDERKDEHSAVGRILAEDLPNPKTQERAAEAGEEITPLLWSRMREWGKVDVRVLNVDLSRSPCVIKNTLRLDNIRSEGEAVARIHALLHPGDTVNVETARQTLNRLFFDARRYDLKKVGRHQINQRLKTNIPPGKTVLVPEDIVQTIRYLIGLRAGQGTVDDIDHLGNRRVLAVGELVANQFSVGLSRMARMVRERMSIHDPKEPLTPHDLVNSRVISSVVNAFFGSSQLSQFLDQPNPLAEIRHKRRLSAFGPGGLTRERAGFEVRDVHHSQYGRICPIETPEGLNIGLITSLSTYAQLNEYGFIVTPYRKVRRGHVTSEIEYLSADQEDQFTIAQANAPLDEKGRFLRDLVLCRHRGDFPSVRPEEVDYMDISPKQLVSLSAALIPFLEHDDANRALMGSNMQCQAVPLLRPEAPIVGTGMELRAAVDSGVVLQARREGKVVKVTAEEIWVKPSDANDSAITFFEDEAYDRYRLLKFRRSNQDTCLSQTPLVREGDTVRKNEILADGPATRGGELALGQNVLAAFMPWGGYNFEDAIVVSEALVQKDYCTSVHIEEFEVAVRETKLGPEEITREIPNVGEEGLRNLDDRGIIRIGAEVHAGDILVGKVSPKGETELSPEERLLRAIFGDKAGDVKDTSLKAPPGMDGVVIDVKIFSRKGESRLARLEERKRIEAVEKEARRRVRRAGDVGDERIRRILEGETLEVTLRDGKEIQARRGRELTREFLATLGREDLKKVEVRSAARTKEVQQVRAAYDDAVARIDRERQSEIEKITRGDELPSDVLQMVKIFIARRRKISVGDKLAGRHGNKGVIARIVPQEDMPYLPDGTPVDLVLNPLGVPSRMNVGQILETHLGWAAKTLGLHVSSPVFEGATLQEIKEELKKAGLPGSGKTVLYDGLTGTRFRDEVTVGYIYMSKLSHLVDDKIHARSTGPYSLVTQQPLGGKAHFGGQRFGEMEVWALEAYGAAYTLQEMLTVKSDDVVGRTRVYEAIVKGENPPKPGVPASFDVMVKELQGLAIDVHLEKD